MGRGWKRTEVLLSDTAPVPYPTAQLQALEIQLGHLPKYDDRSSRAWLYGKLFLALLAEKLARVGSTVSPWGYWLPQTADTQQVA